MTEIWKESGAGQREETGSEELEQINRLSRRTLKAEEVYSFFLRLCDNEVDRDGERFEPETLEELAGLFLGKSGVLDHQWSARGQTARIFRTEVVREPESRTAAGDPYCYLKGYAYMLRTPGNEELIAQIEGGILKEVSVGCAVRETVCSICGDALGQCGHQKGIRYDGQLCYGRLIGAEDAYEWSFVAVPAQKKAGVLKGKKMGERNMELEKALGGEPERLKELAELRKQAALGRRWLEDLRREVVRLGCLADKGIEPELLRSITEKLEAEELEGLRKACQARAEEKYPLVSQLGQEEAQRRRDPQDGAFLI